MRVYFFNVTNVTKKLKRPRDTLTAQEPITRASKFFCNENLKNVTL